MTRPAVLGSGARLKNLRLAYLPPSIVWVRYTKVTITIAGVEVQARVRLASLTIRDALNDAPNTCEFTIEGTPPDLAETIRVTIGITAPRLVFAGAIQSLDNTYEGRPLQRAYQVTAIDDTAVLNRRRPFANYVNASASTVAQDLVQTFSAGITTRHVQTNLPAVTVTFDGSDTLGACLARLANLVGGYFFVDDGDVYLFQGDVSALLVAAYAAPATTPYPNAESETYTGSRYSVSDVVDFVYTYSAAIADEDFTLEGRPSVPSRVVTVAAYSGYPQAFSVQAQHTTNAAIHWIHLWRRVNGGTYRYAGSMANNGSSGFSDAFSSRNADTIYSTVVLPVGLSMIDATLTAPDALTATSRTLQHAPPLHLTADASQLRNVVYGKGHGEPLLADVAVGETILPLADVTMFNPLGGSAILGVTPEGAQFQVVNYAGTVAGGDALGAAPGALVGPGAGPTIALRTVAAFGFDLAEGFYQYAYTFVTAAGESLPSPRTNALSATVFGGRIEAPVGALTILDTRASGNLPVGSYQYQVTFTNGAGETTVGPVATAFVNAVGRYGAPFAYATPSAGGSIPGSAFYRYVLSFVTSTGETMALGDNASWYTGAQGGTGPASLQSFYLADLAVSGDPRVTGRKLYRSNDSGVSYQLIATLDNVQTSYVDTAANAGGSPQRLIDTTGPSQLALTGIPIGPTGTTGRKIYRNGSLVATLSDNSTEDYTDNLATPTTPAPVYNTTESSISMRTIALSGIAIGPSGTTSRRVYRTAKNSIQLKLHTTIANNSATTIASDFIADGSLGADVPTSDTSGLTASSVVANVYAGATAILTSGAGSFLAGGGWVTIGDQTVRYTGLSGNTLTGVPASGAGMLRTTIPYGSVIKPAPLLIGVSGFPLAMLAGSGCHLWVRRDDRGSQGIEAAIDVINGRSGAGGIYEGPIVVDERRGEASLAALCDATLQLYARPIVTVTYATRDPKTRSGKTIHVDLPGYPVGDYIIQDVVIEAIDEDPGTFPLYTVTASSVRFSLEDTLRRLTTAA